MESDLAFEVNKRSTRTLTHVIKIFGSRSEDAISTSLLPFFPHHDSAFPIKTKIMLPGGFSYMRCQPTSFDLQPKP